jgi:DNA damage-binding protein 1
MLTLTLLSYLPHRTDGYFLATTLHETYFYRLDNENTITFVEPASTGFITNQRTLAATNIPRRLSKQGQGASTYANSSLVVQVTASAVTVLEFDMALDVYTRVGQQWTVNSMAAQDPSWNGREIVVASVNPSQFTLGLSGSRIALLNLGNEDQLQFVA